MKKLLSLAIVPYSNSFSFNCDITGNKIGMRTQAKVRNSDGAEGWLNLDCMGSVFD